MIKLNQIYLIRPQCSDCKIKGRTLPVVGKIVKKKQEPHRVLWCVEELALNKTTPFTWLTEHEINSYYRLKENIE